jgi:hypothetical protein
MVDSALDASVSAAVGLAVGIVAFPVRWLLQWRGRVRQDDVAAYRDALRTLRAAQRRARYQPKAEDDGDVSREAIADDAWEEALHRLAEAPDAETYRAVERIAQLSAQSWALTVVFPNAASEDPRGDLADFAVGLLTHKLKHRWKRPPVVDESLKRIAKSAEEAEAELDWRYEQQRKSYRERLAQQHRDDDGTG